METRIRTHNVDSLIRRMEVDGWSYVGCQALKDGSFVCIFVL